ncbi:uncharacterized protein FA14DRAFT_160150 [Meira miltonrushii]|uniref:Uncharacterized protein n=1 Tax=Meira miltonrushii TaxID=1280837 RepID=A0A316VAS1_9BASI|nr:uncharacterized protein FA14DRAFT_160150 [Meira miltonrushii]PWN34626.1 hypothetical protein FA14DRAFT_160150 [Meira miltonrushii]
MFHEKSSHDAPPPSYNQINHDNSLRFLYLDKGIFQPFQPWSDLAHLYWTTNDHDIAYDVSTDPLQSMFQSKFAIYRGNAGSSAPAFTYNQSRATLRDENAGNKMKCDYKRVKDNKSTTLEFKYNKHNLKWTSSQPLSSMYGNTFDTATYVCYDPCGTQLATFAFLSPDGQLDTRMRITQAGSQVLPMEIALATFSILFIEQWGDLRREVDENPIAARIESLRNVQSNFSEGRLTTYALTSFEYIEELIGDIQIEADRRDAEEAERLANRKSSRPNDSSGVMSMNAAMGASIC